MSLQSGRTRMNAGDLFIISPQGHQCFEVGATYRIIECLFNIFGAGQQLEWF
jgi:hypothetical protein